MIMDSFDGAAEDSEPNDLCPFGILLDFKGEKLSKKLLPT